MLRLVTHALARLLPRDLRADHGDEIRGDIDRRFAEGRRLSTLRDVAVTVVRERRQPGLGPSVPRTGRAFMKSVFQDVRFAARALRRRPALSAVITVILGIGIGSATAIISLADATLLRPLAVKDPHTLAGVPYSMSYPDFREMQAEAPGFDGFLAYANLAGVSLESQGGTHRLRATPVSGNYFEMLGIAPVAGRLLNAGDDQTGGVPAVVLSERIWRSAFGGSQDVIGSAARVNGRPVVIVGVAPESFKGLSLGNVGDVWMPAPAVPELATGFLGRPGALTRNMSWLTVVARLREDMSLAEASARLDRFYNERHPPASGSREPLVLEPVSSLAAARTPENELQTFMLLLFAVASALLLLGCSNVANLLLARAASRRQEIGVRAALGAGRGRLVRQLLVESLLLAAFGAIAGVVVAALALGALGQYRLPGDLPIADLGLRINGVVLLSAALLGLASVLIFGPLPAWLATRRDVTVLLRAGGRGSTRLPLGRVLVALQVALCIALVGGGLLFARGLQRALSIDLGYEPSGVAMTSASPALQRLKPAEADEYISTALLRLRSDPGVSAAGVAALRPMRGGMSTSIYVDGYPAPAGEDPHVSVNLVSEGWMEAMGLRLTRGRMLRQEDRVTSPRRALVSETAARTFWPGKDPIGARFKFDTAPEAIAYEVVGVVADARYGAVDADPQPFAYLSIFDPGLTVFRSELHFFVRTDGDPAPMIARIRDAARAVNHSVPLSSPMTMEEHVASVVMPQRLGLLLLVVFASAGLLLSTSGVYAIAAYHVSMRTREIGIRMALGAARMRVMKEVVRDGAVPIGSGLAAGIVLLMWGGKFAEGFVYGLDVRSPLQTAAAAAIVAAAAVAALMLPARRAAGVDPATALRDA